MTTTTAQTELNSEPVQRDPSPAAWLQPELAAALVEFQSCVPSITKGRTANMGTYSYKYADLSDIWEAIREPLKVARLAVTQSLTGGGVDGVMGITTTVWHASGQCKSSTIEVLVGKRTPQEIGSQITYFKRYALSAELGLTTEEDDDGAAATRARRFESEEQPDPKEEQEVAAANAARGDLFEATARYGWTEEKLVRRYWDDYTKNLRNTRDVALIRGFGEALVAEAAAQVREERETDNAELVAAANAAEPELVAALAALEKVSEPITKPMLTKLHTLLSKVDGIKSKDDHLNWCSVAVGREIDSTNDLTKAEGIKLIDKLEGRETAEQPPEPPST